MTRKFLLSAVVSTIAGEFPSLIKPIIAGNFISGPAIAVVALTAPIVEMFYILYYLFIAGSCLLEVEYVCIHDTEKLHKHFTVSAISTLLSTSILALIIYLFNDSISLFLALFHFMTDSSIGLIFSPIQYRYDIKIVSRGVN